MSVSVTEGNWNVRLRVQKDFKYSIWQALAWNHTMCFQSIKSDESDGPTLCQKLGSRDETEFDDQLSFFDTNVDLDADDHPKALAAAITWLFYCNNFSPDERDSSIPISQRLLEIREKSLCSLKKLDEEGNLKSAISALFGDNAEPGSSAIESGPTRILELLESLISASHCMKDRGCFRGILFRLKEDVDKHQILSLCDEDIESLERICKGLPGTDFFRRTTEPNPQSVPGALDRLGSRLATRTLEAKASGTFEELRNLFDPFLSPDVEKEVELGDESSDTTLLAHLLLALSDWGQLPKTHWPLDAKIKTSICKILRISSRSASLCCQCRSPPLASSCSTHIDNAPGISQLLDQALKDSEYGIYTAKDSLTVSKLLNWDKAPDVVYLH
ncbi:hypothetical protein IWZ03DRAFT_411677 [Phyllosticta citriasiana]|uniref:Uncharacterized protein n=1 Tax=Phyllosticta citriasiana TaxID=595635 RepID=A0ABR1KXZ6_9PEZI